MPVLAGIDFDEQSDLVVEAILGNPRDNLIVGEDYVTRSNLSWDYVFPGAKGNAIKILPLHRLEILSSTIRQTPLKDGQEFRLASSKRRYKVSGTSFLLIGGSETVIPEIVVGIGPSLPQTDLPPGYVNKKLQDGYCFIFNRLSVYGRYTKAVSLKDELITDDLLAGSRFCLQQGTWEQFDGERTYPINYPIPVTVSTRENIDLNNLVLKDFFEALDTYKGLTYPHPFPSAAKNRQFVIWVLLKDQVDKRQNGPYEFTWQESPTQIVCAYKKIPPFIDKFPIREGESSVEVWRGDQYGGKIFGIKIVDRKADGTLLSPIPTSAVTGLASYPSTVDASGKPSAFRRLLSGIAIGLHGLDHHNWEAFDLTIETVNKLIKTQLLGLTTTYKGEIETFESAMKTPGLVAGDRYWITKEGNPAIAKDKRTGAFRELIRLPSTIEANWSGPFGWIPSLKTISPAMNTSLAMNSSLPIHRSVTREVA